MSPLLILFLSLAFDDCTISYVNWPEVPVTSYSDCVTHALPGECVVADAGADFSTPPDAAVMLDASGSTVPHDPSARAYFWEQVPNGAPSVALDGAGTATPSFAALQQGTYLFQVTASWYCREDTDTVEVTVSERAIPMSLDAVTIAEAPCQPVQITYSHAGDPRLFIVTKPGVIHIFKNGAIQPTPFLDISDRVSGNCAGSSEQGLLGIAFHPDYASNGLFYINYTGTFPGAGGNGNTTRIVGYGTSTGNPDTADTATETLLLSIDQPFTNHNGGQTLFGPDGMLYIGMGDGGSGGDPSNNAQNGMSLLGKMLRYETNGLDPLTIPIDNPFLADPNVLDDVWAVGLRNPWRFSFDRGTGDLYIGDVGQAEWEEISYESADSFGGLNFGWRLKEGFHCYNPATNCDPGGLTDPIFEFAGSNGYCSVIGGFVYRGLSLPQLDGFYIFSDWCGSGNPSVTSFKSLINLDDSWQAFDLDIYENNNILNDSVVGFGEDSNGELYLCHSDGTLRMVTGIRAFYP